ncbi:hypothetical protein ASPFODRAFT_158454, partial [Aspergillus luchuensis CBS 106.47]
PPPSPPPSRLICSPALTLDKLLSRPCYFCVPWLGHCLRDFPALLAISLLITTLLLQLVFRYCRQRTRHPSSHGPSETVHSHLTAHYWLLSLFDIAG